MSQNRPSCHNPLFTRSPRAARSANAREVSTAVAASSPTVDDDEEEDEDDEDARRRAPPRRDAREDDDIQIRIRIRIRFDRSIARRSMTVGFVSIDRSSGIDRVVWYGSSRSVRV